MRRMSFMIAFLALLTAAAKESHAGLIDTTSGWDGSTGVSSFGEPNTATFGQTFIVIGTETLLNDFTFWVNDILNTDTIDFRGFLMQWDPGTTRATGSVLYQSSTRTTTNNGGLDGMEMHTFNTGGLNLTSGLSYVAFLSASLDFDSEFGTSLVGIATSDTYASGDFVYNNSGNDPSLWGSSEWTIYYSSRDLAFQANFSSVPEPSGLVLLATGMLCLFGYSYWRKKRSVMVSA